MKSLSLTLAALVLLSGCAVTRKLNIRPPSNDYHEQACRVAHYCGPDAGVILIGDKVCYTNHLSQDRTVRGFDGKWHVEQPKDLICR